MAGTGPSVVVVGGGIMGASVAWHLARAGAATTLVERCATAGRGATVSSYGWVGTGADMPSHAPAAFALRLRAIAEFVTLERDLGPLPVAARGALVWGDTEEQTAALIAEHQAGGARMEALSRTDVIAREPRLALPPSLAAWAPNDSAVEPASLARQLLAAAVSAGATVHHGAVETLETAGNRVIGVRLNDRTIPADIVVLANGVGARALGAQVGLELPVVESPAVLLRFAAEPGLVRHLLHASGLEVRPTLDGGLASAAAYPEDGETGLGALAVRTAGAISELLALAAAPALLSVTAARRPMTVDGKPLRSFARGVEGLYTLVAHPGVILAPLLGRMVAGDILTA